jgi:NO-binding membrane sensor protein with MHYT domain
VDKLGDAIANHETRIVVLEGLVSGMRADTRNILELMEKRESETLRKRDWYIIFAFAVGFGILAWMLYVGGPNA